MQCGRQRAGAGRHDHADENDLPHHDASVCKRGRVVYRIGQCDQSGTIETGRCCRSRKISAVGAAALVPSTASADPGPCSHIAVGAESGVASDRHGRSGGLDIVQHESAHGASVVAIRNGGLLSSANGVLAVIRTAGRQET